ncbi:MAG: hypothetical protein JRK53_09510 [Deltaproteobacteria bacterium]|nr:hypothetical protein [Deltaproteobacteria bacterium]MBW2283196.1 hypothetical protein [Deltaproteobacteria bacterium]
MTKTRTLSNRFFSAFFHSPARVAVSAFFLLIWIGTALLLLPCSAAGRNLGFVDALFTSTSAACVTGLVVMDTGTALSLFGQVVVLGLIQAGGLGIMTFSTFLLLLVGRRPSLTEQIVVQDSFALSGDRTFASVLRDVFLFTAVIELIGACLLVPKFVSQTGWAEALYLSIFHAVSAFCNAGFSLFSDSLTAYRDDWLTNLTVCLLIVSGGIGFLVLSELKRGFPLNRRAWRHLSLHTKIVLSATFLLIVLGALAFVHMEWDNTLSGLSGPERVLAACFQSVTARTAGFNTLPFDLMANETLFVIIVLMFIGASPGSCGGGIKTTTLSSLILLGVSRLRGYERPRAFKRTISMESMGKAVSMVMVSIVVVTLGAMLLLMTELGDTSHPASRGKFIELLFETVSAFGTVGLSTGVTATLSTAGKLIVTAIMFVGRLGPLVIGVAVARHKAPDISFAEETIMIG